MDSQQKGDELEQAVQGIESTILRSFPAYSERTFRIESKKIVVVAGVRHEIDIFVTVSLDAGYDSKFIFECKNWEEKVSKNEIIVFAEKINAVQAQRGFFVAKSYSGGAVAQAAQYPRMELLHVTELDPVAVIVPKRFHSMQVDEPQQMRLEVIPATATTASKFQPLDVDAVQFLWAGSRTDLREYIKAWIIRLRDARTNQFPSLQAGLGTHTIALEDERAFTDGEAVLNGQAIARMKLAGTVEVHVVNPVIVSAFDVSKRGRFIKVECNMPRVSLVAQFVQLSPRLHSDGTDEQ